MTEPLRSPALVVRHWPLALIVAAAAAWLGVAVLHAADMAWSVAAIAAALPPLIVGLFAVNALRGTGQPLDAETLEVRLATVKDGSEMLGGRLASLEQTLRACLDQAERLAAVTSADGGDLAAAAKHLAATVADVRQSGTDAGAAAERVAASLPALNEVNRQIAALGGQLGSDTARQLAAVETALAAVGVRGDAVAVQADATVANLNRQLAEVDELSRTTTSRIAKRAYALDAAVDGAAARAAAVLESVADDIGRRMTALDQRLAAARAELEAVGEHGAGAIGERLARLHDAGDRLATTLAGCDDHSRALLAEVEAHVARLPLQLDAARTAATATLAGLRDDVDGLGDRVGGLDGALAGSRRTVDTLSGDIDRLARIADHFGTMLEAGMPTATDDLARLGQSAGALLGHVGEVQTALAAGAASTNEIAALIAATREQAAALGEADLRLVDDRMHATATVLVDVGRRLAAYSVASGETRTAVAADIAALDRQLRVAHADGTARLQALADDVAGVHRSAESLTGSLGLARTLAGDVGAQLVQANAATADLGTTLDARLAATADGFAAAHERATALLGETSALVAATGAGRTAIDAAAERLARERPALTAAAATLGGEYDRLHGVVAALEGETTRVTRDTAAALADALERARGLADVTAAGLRDMVAAVVHDAEQALGTSARALADQAFAEPVRREMAAIGDAAERAEAVAEAAARRVAGQVRTVETAVAAAEAKVAEIETRLDVRTRDLLPARSARLIEMLATASVDVARLLAADVGEDAWVRYLKGDRSVFARRAVRVVDRDTSATIARHYAHDATFREEASHYLDIFERLSRRLLGDPDGETLLTTVVGSDYGKLYVAIARATGRWAPAA